MSGTGIRLARLRQAMAEAQLAALLVTQPESRRYLSGYTGTDLPPRDSAGCLFITDERQYLLTDPRTEAQAAAEAPVFELRVYSGSVRMPDLLKELVAGAHPGAPAPMSVGFEAGHLPYAVWQQLDAALDGLARLVPASDLVDRLRMVKDADELAALRRSITLNDAAFAHLARTVRPGRTEMEMAWELENFVRTHGAEGVAFSPITVAGPNSALPHAVPSGRAIGAEEFVLFDTGARLAGYCSDMTRTFCIEAVPPELERVWNTVLEAQLAAEAQVKPGMTGATVDGVARKVIEDAGYGESFVHGLGHGIGLEVHEPPWLTRSRGDDVLTPGMVFSIEPGVYLPGVGGVRIEDLVLLTETGAEVLPTSPKKLKLAEILRDLETFRPQPEPVGG
jgi:Xaa-Pro aminopeptidase